LDRRAFREITRKEDTALGRLLDYPHGFAVNMRADRSRHERHPDINCPTEMANARI
jgi:hypothetical protein